MHSILASSDTFKWGQLSKWNPDLDNLLIPGEIKEEEKATFHMTNNLLRVWELW